MLPALVLNEDKAGIQNEGKRTHPLGPNGELPPSYDGPTLIAALREQLGLKMESTKAPVEVFIIDRAEKPTEN